MTDKQFDLIVVGHLTIDLIKFGEIERKEMGGPPAYAMAGTTLGLKNIGIVSRVGRDFPQPYYDRLVDSGLNLNGLLRNGETTQFTNIYDQEGGRTQRVDAVAGRLMTKDVPASYWDTEWIHISPVISEIDSSLIPEAKKHDIKVSVDVQGFVRTRKDQDTEIIGCAWETFHEHAAMIDVLKADTHELCQLAQESTFEKAAKIIHSMGVPIILITRGQKGSFLSTNERLHKIPAITAKIVRDLTGSGDVFSIGFLTEFHRTQRPLWSAFFAASAASFNVETEGPTDFPSHDAVTTRLRQFLALPEYRAHTEKLISESGPFECPL
jgi:sugar/nucleoside kinase (ribokinase family)